MTLSEKRSKLTTPRVKQYGDMQLITEAYDILKRGFGMHEKEIADIFERWNKGVLDSYLIEITTEILRYNDDDGVPLVTKIKDAASQKGTGKWTATNALDLGMPVTLIGEAVFARCLSSIKDERVRASKKIGGPQIEPFTGDKKQFIDDLEQALYASKIISYAQGFMLMREAAKDYGWHLNNAGIALMWRGGCIIRSVFLGDITKAFQKTPDLENLLFDDFFNKAIHTAQPGWRRIVAQGALWGIPTPAFSTALSFFDGYRTERLPASLLQAQRDYFGAHTFRVLPQFASEKYPEGKDIHVNVSLSSLFVFVVLGRFLLNADSFLPLGCTVDWPWWQRLGFDLQRLNGVGLASAAVDGSGSSSHTKNT